MAEESINANAPSVDVEGIASMSLTAATTATEATSIKSSTTNIESSPQDDRTYKMITLQNNLTALLISDPTTDKASVAMDVGVGHLSDPDTLPGLAHFCEHLLFMGTTKYPNENEYNVFLTNHGGSSNAYTDMEATNYYFDVASDHLYGAMDRFAQFFISPLFQESTTQRELQAVDSEHAKNLQNDSWREFQLSKSIANTNHPFCKFGSGNSETLEKTPQQKGLDIRQMLLEFHKTYYSANIMKLVVLGKESIEDLQSMVTSNFNQVCDLNISRPSFPGLPFGPNETCRLLQIVPVKEGAQSLKLQFPMVGVQSLYQLKPTHYISHLIGHEGQGSILYILKQKGWANELSAGISNSCSDWSCFSISIDVTNEGLQHQNDIVDIIFSYLTLLKEHGVQRWIYDETATVASCSFQFLSKRNPIDYTCSLANALQIYPPEHVLSGPYKIYDYDPTLIQDFLSKYFTPQNMIVFVTSKTFEGQTTEKERWYGTEYNIQKISQELCTQWSKATIALSSLVDETSLHLPEQNDMIASDFTLLNANLNVPKDEPKMICNNDRCRLFFKPDNVFDMPKVNIMALLRTKAASTMSVVESVMALLWTQIVNEHSNDFTYLASMASLHSSIANVHRGIDITVSGYNHKVHVLLKRIVQTMKEVPDKLELSLFERVKDKVRKEYQNFSFAQPYQHAFYAADLCLETSKWSIEDKVMVLESVEYNDLIQFSRTLLSRFYLEILVHGNVTVAGAKEISSLMLDGLNPSSPTPQSIIPALRVVSLNDGVEYIHRMQEPNESNTNSCIEFLLQIGQLELKDVSVLALLHQLLKEPAFNELRTNEQLGYIVHTSVKTNGDDIKGLVFLIQSDSFDPVYMDDRIEAFLIRLRQKIMSLSQTEFQSNITALRQTFVEKNKNMGEESSKYWGAICSNHYLFKRLHLIAGHLENATKSDVLRFFDKYVSKDSPNRRKLSVQVFAKQHMEKYESAVNSSDGRFKLIYQSDVDQFKQNMPLFPLAPKNDLEQFQF
jgi:insulysin